MARNSKNAKRGFVTLKLSGKSYTLKIGMNALAELDEVLGTQAARELLGNPEAWGFKAIRAMLFVALRDGGHDDEIQTLRDVGDIMTLGDMDACAKAIGDAFNASNTGTTEAPKKQAGGKAGKAEPFRSGDTVDSGDGPGDAA